MRPDDKILLDQKGNEINRIKETGPDQYFMQHDNGNYTWTTTTSVNGTVINVSSIDAIRVLSKESVTGDPRENERSGINDGAAFYRNGTLNEDWTSERQAETIADGIEGVDSRLKIAQHSKGGGSMDYMPLLNAGELINLDGIYMNNHEALNFLWGKSMSEINKRDEIVGGLSVGQALIGAEVYNRIDYIFGHSTTWRNQRNHNEAIVRGYLNSSTNIALDGIRDTQVFRILAESKYNMDGSDIFFK